MSLSSSLSGPLSGHLSGSLSSSAASQYVLDSGITQPKWLSWLGGALRAGQSDILTVERASDNAQMDIGPASNGITDLSALETFVQANDPDDVGYLVSVFNAVSGSSYATIDGTVAGSEAPIIYQNRAPVLSATGRLTALFDGNDGTNVGTNKLTRADLLGLSGDPALTMVVDVDALNGGTNSFTIGCYLGESDVPITGPSSGTFAFEWELGDTSYAFFEVDHGINNYNFGELPVTGEFAGWLQGHRAASATPSQLVLRVNGALLTPLFPLGTTPLTLTLTAKSKFCWGNTPSQPGPTDAIVGKSSAIGLWNAVLSTEEQQIVDSWFSVYHTR